MRAERWLSSKDPEIDPSRIHDTTALQTKHKHLAQSDTTPFKYLASISDLPDHLGWGSQQLSQLLRQSLNNKHQFKLESDAQKANWLEEPHIIQPPTPQAQPGISSAAVSSTKQTRLDSNHIRSLSFADVDRETVKLHPDIGLGILRKKVASSGRIWLLLRWIDQTGSGRIEISRIRDLLCDQGSATRICGWRQLRSLIAQGEGIFWNQLDGRLWLQSIPKIARALDIERLSGRPVALPVNCLTQGIGKVRAHLFASFHSGRKQASPISRTTLSKISQVSPRSQQNYEKQSRVRKLKNYAVGPRLTSDNATDRAWQLGSACFSWHDKKAIHGSQNTAYLAWQLPNSYLGPHEQQPHGRQKQINRELAVLFAKGMTGNDQPAVELSPKCYFETAKKAAYAQNHSRKNIYWRGNHNGLWYFMDSANQL